MQLRSESLTWQVIADDLVVLDLSGSVYLKLNGPARLLWEQLAQGCDESHLVESILAAYDVEEAVAAADVTTFLDDLRSRGLLEDG